MSASGSPNLKIFHNRWPKIRPVWETPFIYPFSATPTGLVEGARRWSMGRANPLYQPGVRIWLCLNYIKALVGYQACASSHTMNPPFAPREMWDPTVSMAMGDPESPEATHSSGTSCDLGTTEETKSEEWIDAPAQTLKTPEPCCWLWWHWSPGQ